MIKLTTTLIDNDTKKAYNRNTIEFKSIEDATKYIESLQKNLSMKYTSVRYTITVK